MPIDQQFLDEIKRKLAVHAPSLAAEYLAAMLEVQPVLSEADFRTWAEEGVGLASYSLRSWGAAVDYFRVSSEVMRVLPSAAFRHWTHAGRDLAEYSSVIAAAFFQRPAGVQRGLSPGSTPVTSGCGRTARGAARVHPAIRRASAGSSTTRWAGRCEAAR